MTAALTGSLFSVSEDALNQNHPMEPLLDSLLTELIKHNFMKCYQNFTPKENCCPAMPHLVPSCLGSPWQPSWGIWPVLKAEKKKWNHNSHFLSEMIGILPFILISQSLLCVCLPWSPIISRITPLSCFDPTTLLSLPFQTLLLCFLGPLLFCSILLYPPTFL